MKHQPKPTQILFGLAILVLFAVLLPLPTITRPAVMVVTPVTLNWQNPIKEDTPGVSITAHVGWRYGGKNIYRPNHTGLDIGAPKGTPVYAVERGTVTHAGWDWKNEMAGIVVRISHPENYESAYLHLNEVAVSSGAQVTPGQLIGSVGNTGSARGYHLHFSIKKKNNEPLFVDPLSDELNKRLIPGGYKDDTDPDQGERMPGQTSGGILPKGGGGGLESMPLWMWEGGAFSGPMRILTKTEQLHPSPLWKWATEGSAENFLSSAVAQSVTYTIALTDLMPVQVFTNTVRVTGEPENVIGWSNALEAIYADYIVPETGEVAASINAYRTVGSVYAHDHPVCTRFKNGHLVYATPITVAQVVSATSPAYFWRAFMVVDEVAQEDAAWFVAYVSEDESHFLIDSRWMSEQYPITDSGYILTFQVRGEEPIAVAALINDILHNLASRGSLAYRNEEMPTAPQIFVRDASYGYGQVRMTVFNTSLQSKTLGFTAITWSAPYPESERTDYFTRSVPPGVSTVALSLPGRLNGVIYVGDGEGFVDKLYVADGHWWAFNDGASQATIVSANCSNYTGMPDDLLVAGCARLTGNVATAGGYIGVARDLAALGQSVDLSNYSSVRFRIRGDGKPYMVKLETWAPNNGKYHYGRVITPTSSWQDVTISFNEFEPLWNAPRFNPAAVKTISWATIGGPHSSIELEIDQLAFFARKFVYLPIVMRSNNQ